MEFRQMAAGDIEAGLQLCRASGWNQLADDWRCFLAANPEGCRVACEAEEVAGTVTTLRFEDRFSWISMLLVAPQSRGRGIGTGLLMEALRVLADVGCVRLDATPAGKLVYDQCGFHDEYPLVRMRAEVVTAAVGAETGAGVRRMEERDWPRVSELDREVFGAARPVVLDHLRRNAREYAVVAEQDGGIAGFAMGRHGFRAEHVGPVVARDEAMARALVSACVSAHPDRGFLLDAPEHSAEWLQWLDAAGFRKERPFTRMYRGTAPEWGAPERQFAIVGPEFG